MPILEKKGYKVKSVEFNDSVQPSLALAQGSLDANSRRACSRMGSAAPRRASTAGQEECHSAEGDRQSDR